MRTRIANARTVLSLGLAVVIFAMLAAGCTTTSDDGDSPPAQTDDGDQATVEPSPTSAPTIPADEEDVELAVDSTSALGFDMFRGLADVSPDDNVITSPYSASVFLTMLLNGAAGETRQAIGEVLGLEDPFEDSINAHQRSLARQLVTSDDEIELSTANSLWSRQGTPFQTDFIEAMRDYFEAEVREVDLASEETVEEIDQWVSDQTNERIEEMAEDLGLPDANVVLILMNAVYFKGDWTLPFDPDQTENGAFTGLDGSEIEVQMMRQDDMFQYAQLDGFEALRLTYGESERFGMDFFLPSHGTDFHEFREGFDQQSLDAAHRELAETRVEIRVPKFELEYDTGEDLIEVLSNLGMEIAFMPGADFSAMIQSSPWLDTVIQKTYLRVDEEGSEAAAVTGGAMIESAPPQFSLDRPFLFSITDSETGAILFFGQITEPTSD